MECSALLETSSSGFGNYMCSMPCCATPLECACKFWDRVSFGVRFVSGPIIWKCDDMSSTLDLCLSGDMHCSLSICRHFVRPLSRTGTVILGRGSKSSPASCRRSDTVSLRELSKPDDPCHRRNRFGYFDEGRAGFAWLTTWCRLICACSMEITWLDAKSRSLAYISVESATHHARNIMSPWVC